MVSVNLPRQGDTTVVNVVTYFTCPVCDKHWHVQEPEARDYMDCECGEECAPVDQEEVDV
jgi:hypothetical protein